MKFRDVLSDSMRAKQHRENLLNIHITFLAWAVECIGFLTIFLGQFILGHENNIANFSLQSLTIAIYFIILPSIYLTNVSEFKEKILDSNRYSIILHIFNCLYERKAECRELSVVVNIQVDEGQGNNNGITASNENHDSTTTNHREDQVGENGNKYKRRKNQVKRSIKS